MFLSKIQIRKIKREYSESPKMNQLVSLITIFIFLIFPVNAEKTHNPLKPSIAVVVSVLFGMFLVLFLILLYTKFCYMTIPEILSLHHDLHGFTGRTSFRHSGLDKTVIQTLPFFVFSSLKGSKEGLECSVCLSKFEDSDVLRFLPICRHAFHMKCIDMWLEAHVSCPLCRYKFHVDDLSNFGSTASIKYPQDLSNLSNNPNCHELFVQREEESLQASLRVDSGRVEPLVPSRGKNFDQERAQNFNHRIIVNDIIDRSRWSDVKSSDLLFLNSQMISVASSSTLMNENVARNNGSGRISRSNSLTRSTSNNLRSLNGKMKRSMSDIVNISRFKEYIVNNNRNEESLLNGNDGKEERMKKLWFSMGRKTVQLFNGQEKISKELEGKRYSSNV